VKARILSLMTIALVAGLAGPAKAIPVTFDTAGVFSQSGTNIYNVGGVTITFTGASNSVDVPPASAVTYGTFNTTGTTAPTSEISLERSH